MFLVLYLCIFRGFAMFGEVSATVLLYNGLSQQFMILHEISYGLQGLSLYFFVSAINHVVLKLQKS